MFTNGTKTEWIHKLEDKRHGVSANNKIKEEKNDVWWQTECVYWSVFNLQDWVFCFIQINLVLLFPPKAAESNWNQLSHFYDELTHSRTLGFSSLSVWFFFTSLFVFFSLFTSFFFISLNPWMREKREKKSNKNWANRFGGKFGALN